MTDSLCCDMLSKNVISKRFSWYTGYEDFKISLQWFQSTHPLRGATCIIAQYRLFKIYFNPHTPCGVRLGQFATEYHSNKFQSTHPLRGATSFPPIQQFCHSHFNPHTPCGVRLTAHKLPWISQTFQSTHPLRGATETVCSLFQLTIFQSTHPLRGATRSLGRDNCYQFHFNPHTPCGVRHSQSLKTS